jgi:two-component system chemotaxis response regulator CheB
MHNPARRCPCTGFQTAMQAKNVIVVGASSGGVRALQELVRGFPETLPAAVFVVLHSSPDGPALLGQILNTTGPLPASNAVDGEHVECGRVYVAPPDSHLVCHNGAVHLWRGPKENLHRPCINVTFRSAAAEYGARVIGAVLTGMQDDGTAGLWSVRQSGGTVMIQSPSDAEYPDMPRNVMKHVTVDYSVAVSEMGKLMAKLVCESIQKEGEKIQEVNGMERQEPILATCPDCNGPLREVRLAEHLCEYRCLVGHAYSPVVLLKGHDDAEERALWGAAAALEQSATVARRVGEWLSDDERLRTEEDAAEKLRLAAELKALIARVRKFRVPFEPRNLSH